MPRTADPAAIRAVLETDRPWAVYPLGDLSPGLFEDCAWFLGPGPALVLLYSGFDAPVLFTLGAPAALRPLLEEAGPPGRMHLHVRPEALDLLRDRYAVRDEKTMRRMLLDPMRYRPAAAGGVARLGPADLPALERLYALARAAGEGGEFFSPAMLRDGVYFGVWEGAELAAAAGTHLVVPAEGVAAIGNVYTRPDRRGRGYATRLTSAVAGELLGRGARTVALNVQVDNAAAIGVYERLGFAPHCVFKEGLAERREGPA
jgi:GNAT superfamily N-acetyltransferase